MLNMLVQKESSFGIRMFKIKNETYILTLKYFDIKIRLVTRNWKFSIGQKRCFIT